MDAVLIDRGGGVHDAERIEEMHFVALFGQPDGYGRAVNSRAHYSDFHTHDSFRLKLLRPLRRFAGVHFA
jgi:hypothetical protein